MNVINIDDFTEQDGGIVKTIYSNAITIANVAIADSESSDELKQIASQMKMQTELLYNEYKKQHVKTPNSHN